MKYGFHVIVPNIPRCVFYQYMKKPFLTTSKASDKVIWYVAQNPTDELTSHKVIVEITNSLRFCKALFLLLCLKTSFHRAYPFLQHRHRESESLRQFSAHYAYICRIVEALQIDHPTSSALSLQPTEKS